MNSLELTPMEFNFFEAPNKITMCNLSMDNIVVAELDFSFDGDFTIDRKSFEMLLKLKTDRKLEIKQHLIIKSKEGKFKANYVEKNKPIVSDEAFEFEHEYSMAVLRKAARYVGKQASRPQLMGVIFDNLGNVYGSDAFKLYKHEVAVGQPTRYWSVPVDFLNLIKSDTTAKIKFSNSKVMYEKDYKAISSIYAGPIPNFDRLINSIDNKNKLVVKAQEEMTFFKSDYVEIHIRPTFTEYVFKDQINEFIVKQEQENGFEGDYVFSSDHFMTLVSTYESFELQLNDEVRPALVEVGKDKVVILPIKR